MEECIEEKDENKVHRMKVMSGGRERKQGRRRDKDYDGKKKKSGEARKRAVFMLKEELTQKKKQKINETLKRMKRRIEKKRKQKKTRKKGKRKKGKEESRKEKTTKKNKYPATFDL